MHSFENNRICQSKNSDVHRGEVEVQGEYHFRGLTNPDVNRKRMHRLLSYMTLHVSLFLVLFKYFHKFTQVRCSLCTEAKIISTTAFQVSETLMKKNCIFKMNKFLIQNINLTCGIHDLFIS